MSERVWWSIRDRDDVEVGVVKASTGGVVLGDPTLRAEQITDAGAVAELERSHLGGEITAR